MISIINLPKESTEHLTTEEAGTLPWPLDNSMRMTQVNSSAEISYSTDLDIILINPPRKASSTHTTRASKV